jgi:hypothetical protein
MIVIDSRGCVFALVHCLKVCSEGSSLKSPCLHGRRGSGSSGRALPSNIRSVLSESALVSLAAAVTGIEVGYNVSHCTCTAGGALCEGRSPPLHLNCHMPNGRQPGRGLTQSMGATSRMPRTSISTVLAFPDPRGGPSMARPRGGVYTTRLWAGSATRRTPIFPWTCTLRAIEAPWCTRAHAGGDLCRPALPSQGSGRVARLACRSSLKHIQQWVQLAARGPRRTI